MSGFSVTQLLETKLCRASTRNAAVAPSLQRLSPVGRFCTSIILREVQIQSTRNTNPGVKLVREGRKHARTIIQSRIPDVGTCNCINSRIFPSVGPRSLPLHALIRPVTVKIAGWRSCLLSVVDISRSTAAQKLKSQLQLQNTSIQHEPNTLRIFISTGDVSGDLHATGLVKELQKLAKMAGQDISICALGGGTIEEAGVSLVGDNRGLSSIGLLEALPLVLPTLRLQSKVRAFLHEHPPDIVVLIDYPGVNIPFGRYLRKEFGCPVVYYVPPNEWLWNQARTPAICAASDAILCTYPREAAYFESAGGHVQLVGHPLLDALAAKPERAAARVQLGVSAATVVVALLPASRPQEIRHVWPLIGRAAQLMQEQWTSCGGPPLHFYIPVVSEGLHRQIQASLQTYHLGTAVLWKGDSHVVLAAADLALTKSGTVTLELALFQVPQVVVYRIDAVTAWLARAVFKFNVPHISLVNLILEEALVPEFIQEAASAEAVAAAALRLLWNEGDARDKVLLGYQRLNARLGGPGAAAKAAAIILQTISPQAAYVDLVETSVR